MFQIIVDNRAGHQGARGAGAVARCLGIAATIVIIGSVGCSGKEPGNQFDPGTGGSSAGNGGTGTGGSAGTGKPSGGGGSVGTDPPIAIGGNQTPSDGGGSFGCTNLGCQQTTCTGSTLCKEKACDPGAKTSVHGTVYDPAGKVPLYNVVVYVPNGDVPPLTTGASCDRCESRVLNPVVSTLTDTNGNFVLDDVPVGTNIPLVMQVGKWRRVVNIPTVPRCVDTALDDKNMTRLPRNKAEGNIPLIAITTGGADSMECLPRRMGIDDAEFTTEAGEGRIHLYKGGDQPGNGGGGATRAASAFAPTVNGGAVFTPATTVWADVDHLKAYDLVILSCEGNIVAAEKPPTALQAMYDYESLGGRVFASHWHRYWFSNGPAPVPQIGTWSDLNDLANPAVGTIDTSFPKGQALSEWLVNVGASTTAGQLSISDGRDNIQSVDPLLARRWITVDVPARVAGGRGGGMAAPAHTAIEYASFNAPLMVPDTQQCGRAVFNDLHVSSTGMDRPGQPFPAGCEVRDLTAQEKAVEFLLFDLSSCVQKDEVKPVPPPSVN